MDENRHNGPHDDRPRDTGGSDPLTSSAPPPSDATTSTDAEPAGRADDYVDIYLSPSEVFERRRDGRFGQALIVLIIASVIVYYIFLPAGRAIMQAQMAEQMAENPDAAAAMQSFSGTMQLVGGIFVPIGISLMVVIFGALLKGLAAIFKIPITFKQALVITTFSGFITLLSQIAGSISIMLANRDNVVEVPRDMSFGVARFLDPDAVPAVAIAMLGLLDIFAIWTAVIVAIGLMVIGRAGKGEAIAAAAILWLVSAVPGVIGALMGG